LSPYFLKSQQFINSQNFAMKKDKAARRNFLKMVTLGLGGLSIDPSMGTSKGKTDLMPNSTGPEKKLHVLCVGAHPGDPEFGCGGTMAKYSDAGHSVTFLYLTRGEAGDPTKSYAESAALRTKEAETACALLKVKPLFAGQVDANTILSKEKNEEMSKLIMSEKPDLLFTHWPLDAHPDHQVSGLLALTTWVRSDRHFDLYFYEVNTGSETIAFTPTDYVDITSVRDKKKAAMFAHKTQFPQDVYDSYFKTMEEFRGLEAGVKAAEGFIRFKVKNEKATITGL
jgi:LmbE family N-acetylglucosaminyl deacetylase